ncbi:MAG: histidinol dehydrogenase [Planctomycetota bacterium]
MSGPLLDLTPTDPRLAGILGDTHQRMQRLIDEAQVKARAFYQKTLGRPSSIEEMIDEIFAAVEREGNAAVVRYVQAFDGASLPINQLRVATADIEAAYNRCSSSIRAAIEQSVDQVARYQRRLLPRGFGEALDEPLGVRWLPVDSAGAYVPGGASGSLPLFSSVIMNLVPAQVAGVPRTVLVTPPRRDGSIADEVLAAAKVIGVNEVYRIGGIPAIAALAVGTDSIARVETVVGPGNIFVTLAKRRAYGRVNLDMLAGPSEVLVIADATANPRYVAADLLSQAEHDVLAMCVLLSIGDDMGNAVQAELSQQLAALPEERRSVASESLARFGRLVRCSNLDEAIGLANRIAAEHVELLVADPKSALAQIRHAGAIFVGPWSPEPIGDYMAGPSHTLPTGGGARRWSGIGADTFMRRSSIINLGESDFRALAQSGIIMARSEGLEAHARSIAVRLDPSAA